MNRPAHTNNEISSMQDSMLKEGLGLIDEVSECSSFEEDDPSSVSTSKVTDDEENETTVRKKGKLAQKESAAVFRLRVLVIVVLLLAAVAVSIIVFFITKSSEQDEFETQFEGAGAQVLEAFEAIVAQKLGAISSLAVALIAHGVDHKSPWPFVTLSSFQQRSSTAMDLSDALFVAIVPFVVEDNRREWENFVTEEDSYWIEEGYLYQEELGIDKFLASKAQFNVEFDSSINLGDYGKFPIYYEDGQQQRIDLGPGPYLPVWQTSPVLKRNWVNRNILHDPFSASDAERCMRTAEVIIGEWDIAPPGNQAHPNSTTAFYSSLLSVAASKNVQYKADPMSRIYLPIFDSFEIENRVPVAVMIAIIDWATYFEGILPQNVDGVTVVLENTCNGAYSYRIDGEKVIPLGSGDRHDPAFNYLEQTTSFEGLEEISDGTRSGLRLNQDSCAYSLSVYPSQQFSNNYSTNNPAIMTLAVVLIFIFTAVLFLVYDRLVESRQRVVLRKATQTSAIVSSLFPENVRERLMQGTHGQNSKTDRGAFLAPNHRLKSYLKGGDSEKDLGMAPIADLFPHSTVLFADISGFTAWSSTREPAQVFILLQTVYQAFDIIAKRLKVFKVETIGDSYVAVTGLPEPQPNHAIIMAKFARECLHRMSQITSELEISLGPETGDLAMRFGLHSGPVTAGVLRGERARFQLFGDTVNTAARMEGTGVRNKIQLSQSTADLIIEGGKPSWVKPREDSVVAKGKGVLNTFWLTTNPIRSGSVASSSGSEGKFTAGPGSQDIQRSIKHERHIDWISELFQSCIKKIVAMRWRSSMPSGKVDLKIYEVPPNKTSLDEVAEVINLPRFDARSHARAKNHLSIELDPVVIAQIRQYVSMIATLYRSNPFHNFEHACHVTMAVNKLLKRVVAPDLDESIMDENGTVIASHLHDYTHGINSDPLTIFAIIFSALIHDADHRGVSNMQLTKEDKDMADHYRNKSVAEQNSLDISWDLLMSKQFKELRGCIFDTQTELMRFRQVIVNVVLATDIFDKELNDLRRNRWENAFSGVGASREDYNDLRATIVIEHIIQASDVAHTMQHWHVYCKWNRRLFLEMYAAYRQGRMAKDPSKFWYEGEIGFFDNYIIPLAKKLKDCNVFGVSSDECLNYALQNRAEWAERGRDVVAELLKEVTIVPSSPLKTPLKRLSLGFGNKERTAIPAPPLSQKNKF